jgi:hypothetical protein
LIIKREKLVASSSTEERWVEIGGVVCVTKSWNETIVVCMVGLMAAGKYEVQLRYLEGLAASKAPVVFTAILVLDTVPVLPTTSFSYGGDALLTISGNGFASNISDVYAHTGITAPRTSRTELSAVVMVCGQVCAIQTLSMTELTYRIPPLLTALAIEKLAPSEAVRRWSGTTTGNAAIPIIYARAFDQDLTLQVDIQNANCSLGVDYGINARLRPTRFRFHPIFKRVEYVMGGRFQSSNDGLTFTTISTIEGNVHDGWNYIDIAKINAARYIRYVGPGRCSVAELEFIGLLEDVADATDTASSIDKCDVLVTVTTRSTNLVNGNTRTSSQLLKPATIAYDWLSTPTVSAISANNGTALGGTLVTISGTHFVADRMSVNFNRVECIVQSVDVASSPNTLVCLTGVRDAVRSLSVVVRSAGQGMALRTSPGLLFRYLDKWSWRSTWGGTDPPVEGDTVVIPEGQRVLLDVSPPRLFLMLVQGTLVFSRAVEHIFLNASYILVQGGNLEVGSEDEPYLSRATITLHGDRLKSIEIPHIGAKVLAVSNRYMSKHAHGAGAVTHKDNMAMEVVTMDDKLPLPDMPTIGASAPHHNQRDGSLSTTIFTTIDGASAVSGSMPTNIPTDTHPRAVSMSVDNAATDGVLDLHGRPRLRTWTKLASNAAAGTMLLTLSEDIDWEKGDVLVVTSSETSWREAEEVQVAERQGERTVLLTLPLRYTHRSEYYIPPTGEAAVDLRVAS